SRPSGGTGVPRLRGSGGAAEHAYEPGFGNGARAGNRARSLRRTGAPHGGKASGPRPSPDPFGPHRLSSPHGLCAGTEGPTVAAFPYDPARSSQVKEPPVSGDEGRSNPWHWHEHPIGLGGEVARACLRALFAFLIGLACSFALILCGGLLAEEDMLDDPGLENAIDDL